MDKIYEWLRVVLSYRIISVIILEMVPGEKNKRFISVFAGLVMILMLMEPLAEMAKLTDSFEFSLMENIFSREYSSLEGIESEAENMRRQAVLTEYTEVIRENIKAFIETEGLVADTIEVEYEIPEDDNSGISISKIYVTVSRKYARDEAVKNAYENIHGTAASIEEINIKNSISNFYKISIDNIIYEEQ